MLPRRLEQSSGDLEAADRGFVEIEANPRPIPTDRFTVIDLDTVLRDHQLFEVVDVLREVEVLDSDTVRCRCVELYVGAGVPVRGDRQIEGLRGSHDPDPLAHTADDPDVRLQDVGGAGVDEGAERATIGVDLIGSDRPLLSESRETARPLQTASRDDAGTARSAVAPGKTVPTADRVWSADCAAQHEFRKSGRHAGVASRAFLTDVSGSIARLVLLN